MKFNILFYNEKGDKETMQVSAYNPTEAMKVGGKRLGLDWWKFKEQIFDIRRMAENGKGSDNDTQLQGQ